MLLLTKKLFRFSASFILGTDTSDGRHGFSLQLPDDYESRSSNPKAGTYPFLNRQTVYITSGALQLIPTSFATSYEAIPYHTGTVETKIPVLDARDWYIDYFNGVFFQQDPPGTGDNSSNVRYVDAYLYTGKMADEVISSASEGGSGSPGGSNTQVQFNDGGSFAGDSDFTFTKATNTLKVTNLMGSLTKLSDSTSYLIAGDNITIVSGAAGNVTISSTAGNFFRNKTAYTIESQKSAETAVTVASSDFSKGEYNPNNIDVFVNGQLTLSGTFAQVQSGDVDYTVSGQNELKFSFDLEIDDILTVSIFI